MRLFAMSTYAPSLFNMQVCLSTAELYLNYKMLLKLYATILHARYLHLSARQIALQTLFNFSQTDVLAHLQ
jgi:hypothetical protein